MAVRGVGQPLLCGLCEGLVTGIFEGVVHAFIVKGADGDPTMGAIVTGFDSYEDHPMADSMQCISCHTTNPPLVRMPRGV